MIVIIKFIISALLAFGVFIGVLVSLDEFTRMNSNDLIVASSIAGIVSFLIFMAVSPSKIVSAVKNKRDRITSSIDENNADLYALAELEINAGEIDKGLWSKALVKAKGDENLRKVEYMKFRVSQLKREPTTSKIDVEKTILVSQEDSLNKSVESFDRTVAESKLRDLGFTWWNVWGLLGITVGNFMLFSQLLYLGEFGKPLLLLNTALMIAILMKYKYAFLIATIVSLNPLLWVVNGIYLKNRWNHPELKPGKNLLASK
jgi:hypothetical protein